MRTTTSLTAVIILAFGAPACGGSSDTGGGGSGGGSAAAGGSGASSGSSGAGGGSAGSGGSSAAGGSAGSGGGTAGGGSGGTSGGAGSGGFGGVAGAGCTELVTKYAAALKEAKKCDSSIDVPQCTDKTSDSLLCGCPTFYNPANKAAVSELATLSKQATSMGCQVPCPEIACFEPQGATCVATGAGTPGECKDKTN